MHTPSKLVNRIRYAGRNRRLDPLKASLASIAKNARSLLSDAELLLDHGRYARTAALAVLAIEEVGKFYLLKWDRTEAKQAMRYHPPKQRIVADVVAATAAFDAYERTLHSMGLDWKLIEDVTPAEQKWMDSQGGWDNFAQKLKSDTPIIGNMAEAFKEVFKSGLVRETLAGTFSRWKERGFYVDVSGTSEILSDPNDLTKEQAEECLAYAKSAIVKILK